MKLLIVTQKIDKNDPVLGFMHRWVEKFANKFEQITVIALGIGEHSLPSNVKILSLGKERKLEARSWKLKAIFNFYKYIWQERRSYDRVLVHMNQEYVILAGDLWRLMGKKVFLWRNHAVGGFWTDFAVYLSSKVFCTSPSSYTAKFKKTVLMPVGVDTGYFKPDPRAVRPYHSILFLGRISPVKRVLEFVEWFNTLDESYTATVAGSALPKDKGYEDLVRSKASDRIKFVGSVTQAEALTLYQTHEIYVNKTLAGSMDKTIFEAAACGCKLMVDNPDAQSFKVEDHSLDKLTERLWEEMQ